jgi:PAS domain S-box-containing protein
MSRGHSETSRKLRQHIAWRFISVVFILSLILTTLYAIIHLTFTYNSQMRAIEKEAQTIAKSASPALGASLWVMDQELIQSQLEGIVRRPYLKHARIEFHNKTIGAAGTSPKHPGTIQTFPIFYELNQKSRYLGTLAITSELEGVYNNIVQEFLYIFMITGTQILLTAMCILFYFKSLVARPLEGIADYTQRFKINSPNPPLSLPGRPVDNPNADEIDQMVKAINIMGEHIQGTFHQLEEELKRRQETEEALRRSEEQYRLIYEYAGDAIYTFDRDFMITGVNRRTVEIFGLPQDQLIGRNILELDILLEEDRDKPLQDMKRLISGEEVIHNEIRLVMPEGKIKYLEITRAALYGVDGQLSAVTNIARDITHRKEREARLQLMASVIDQSDQGIIISDPQGYIEYINPFITQKTGHRPENIIGQHLQTFLEGKPEDQRLSSEIYQTLIRGMSWKGQLTIKKKDGGTLVTSQLISPIINPQGQITNVVSFSHDVTRQIQLEAELRQSQKRQALGTLAGGIAHEFNNILGAIIGYVEIELYDLPEGGQTYANLQKILKSSLRARDLIKQILIFNRQNLFDRRSVRIRSVIEDALALLRPSLPATLELITDFKAKNDFIKADPTELIQILVHLTNNAVWAMEGKPGFLAISLEDFILKDEKTPQLRKLSPGPYSRLSVRDSGKGIEPQHLERIFDPFFTTKGTGEGTGMGLAVVTGIVESLGGAVQVESLLGKGSIFQIYLPRQEAPEPQEEEPGLSLVSGQGRILFVDDEAFLAETGAQLLTRLGYEVTSRISSLEALEIFRADPAYFDLVITDQTMAQMTGMDLAREILVLRPDLPIILCTGFSEGITAEIAEAAGLKALVIKPLILEKLSRLIRSLLPKK